MGKEANASMKPSLSKREKRSRREGSEKEEGRSRRDKKKEKKRDKKRHRKRKEREVSGSSELSSDEGDGHDRRRGESRSRRKKISRKEQGDEMELDGIGNDIEGSSPAVTPGPSRRVIGPARPSADMLAAAAQLTEAEARLREAELELENDPLVGPPPPTLVAEAAFANEAERFEEVTKLKEIPVANDPPVRNTGTLNRVETDEVSGKENSNTKTTGNAEGKIKELEAKVREMERRLQQVAQSEEERIEILERRLLMKAKVSAGNPATATKTGKGISGTKKEKKATTKSKSGKPNINKLGSASRLKAKERQILTGVIQKYVSGSTQ